MATNILSADAAKKANLNLVEGHQGTQALHDTVVAYRANRRTGTASTKGRGAVRGSGKKLWAQKGTGNARTGGIRNPVKKGGGHAKQTLPTDFRQEMPVKARRLARGNALLAKIQSEQVRVVDKLTLTETKTSQVVKIFKALGINRSCCLATSEHDPVVYRSARNIQRCTVTTVRQLNAWDILQSRVLLVSKDGLEKLLA